MHIILGGTSGLGLETPLQELDSVKEFSAEELAEAWPRLRYGIYI